MAVVECDVVGSVEKELGQALDLIAFSIFVLGSLVQKLRAML